MRQPVALFAADVIPYWDRAVQQLGDQAVIVYPQSTGKAGTGNTQADIDPIKGPKYRQVGLLTNTLTTLQPGV